MESLRLPFTKGAKIKIARNDIDGTLDFTPAVKKKWKEKFDGDLDGFVPGDLELEASILGVFEDIWDVDLDEAESAQSN